MGQPSDVTTQRFSRRLSRAARTGGSLPCISPVASGWVLTLLTFLGTASAVAGIGHENTFLVVEGDSSTVMIDCAGSPLQRLQMAGIDPLDVDYLVLTHAHPDHIGGFPVFALGLWLVGQQNSLSVVGERGALETAAKLLALFNPDKWPGFHAPQFRSIDLSEESVLLDLPDLLITACQTQHLVPGLALRILSKASGQVLVYSSDTEPAPQLVQFARGADVLVHEASGPMRGHSTAGQAGQVATAAGVGKLFLIHYPANGTDLKQLLTDAQSQFAGPTELARDFGVVEW